MPMKACLVPLLALALSACSRPAALPPEDPPDEDFVQLERNTRFDGTSLEMFVTLDDGTVATVTTADDLIEARPGATPIPGHRAWAGTFLRETPAGTSVAHSLLSWDPEDPTDYIVFGWWTQFPGQHPPELSFEESEQYALIDGPELDHGVVPEVPVEGTASYFGQAGGLYTYEAGSDWGEDEGASVIDEYVGIFTLTADFADGTLRGSIGCVGDLVTQRAHFGVVLGRELRDVQATAADYELHLATAIVREDGTFERDRLTVRHPERTITQSEGDWGGTLSSRQDTDGHPRLVAGFTGVEFQESDGSEGLFIGSFLGLSAPFLESGDEPVPGAAN